MKTCFCPCVTIGEVVEILDQGTTCKKKKKLLTFRGLLIIYKNNFKKIFFKKINLFIGNQIGANTTKMFSIKRRKTTGESRIIFIDKYII